MTPVKYKLTLAVVFTTGIWSGSQLSAMTKRPAPDSHEGVSATGLGAIGGKSMLATIGLAGHKLQMRKISLLPGGKIAKHSHSQRPGLVWMLEGSWTEGRDSGETSVTANSDHASLLEDENTTHWFFNDTAKPATAIVCDIVADE